MEENHEEKDACGATTSLRVYPKSSLFEIDEIVIFPDQPVSTRTSLKCRNLQSWYHNASL